MRVKTEQLKEGCILIKDVFAGTVHPIIRKKTVLESEHLEVLKAFFIKEVEVEKKLIDGTLFSPSAVDMEEEAEEAIINGGTGFLDYYLEAVQMYKTLFQKWIKGVKLDMEQIRRLLSPLIEKMMSHPNKVLVLHHYSTKRNYLYHHAISTALLSIFLARKQGLSKKEIVEAGVAGALCNAGMARLPERIRTNKGYLAEHEYEEIKNHPYHSYQMLKDTQSVSNHVLLAVLQHHEREDGSGYPLQLKSNNIHKLSRIVSVADVYHAMTTERYYREKQSPYKVIDEMTKSQFGKLDPETLQLLRNALITFSIGTMVRLSDGRAAKILYIDNRFPTYPTVHLHDMNEVLQLTSGKGPFIEEILPE